MKNDLINNWRPEVGSLLKRLIAAGCTILRGDNGEETFKFKNEEQFITELTACDEASFYVRTPTSPASGRWVYLVLGNDPGELVCDYTVDEDLEKVCQAHNEEWEGKSQPKMERQALYAIQTRSLSL